MSVDRPIKHVHVNVLRSVTYLVWQDIDIKLFLFKCGSTSINKLLQEGHIGYRIFH